MLIVTIYSEWDSDSFDAFNWRGMILLGSLDPSQYISEEPMIDERSSSI
jgi:hypothetical protein